MGEALPHPQHEAEGLSMGQKFHVDKSTRFTHENGAIAYGPGGSFDCLGRWAKVVNCPVECEGVDNLRLTCYATGYADTVFSVPACTRYKGQHIGGFFSWAGNEGGSLAPRFVVVDRYREKVKALHSKGS